MPSGDSPDGTASACEGKCAFSPWRNIAPIPFGESPNGAGESPALPALNQGFTLVEVLIGTLCFAVILAALNSAFYAALHLQAQTTKLVENAIPMNQVAAIIKRDLRNIVAPGGTLAGSLLSETEAQGMGNSHLGRLELYTSTGVINDEQYWGEVQKVAYYLEEPEFLSETNGMDLVRAVTRNLLPSATEDLTELRLIGGVESLEFYFYSDTEWRDTWDSTIEETPLPQAIKFLVHFAPAEAAQKQLRPMEFVVPLVTQARTNQTAGADTGSPAGPGTTGPPAGGGPLNRGNP